MSAYALPATGTATPQSHFCNKATCIHRRPRPTPVSQSCEFVTSRRFSVRLPPVTSRHRFSCVSTEPRKQTTEDSQTPLQPIDDATDSTEWKQAVQPGAVIEIWSQGELQLALVSSLYDKGAIAHCIKAAPGPTIVGPEAKVSFGEIISVWSSFLTPCGPDALQQLVADVERGLRFVKNAPPRSLDLAEAYEALRKFGKNDPRSMNSSMEIADMVFPMTTRGSRERNAARTVAAALLLSSDSIRFKRAPPGKGWRALPPSVVVARGRCSFVDACKSILEQRSSGSGRRTSQWSKEHMEILRELEIYAASGTAAEGIAATALEDLRYAITDDGAAQLLLDLAYWTNDSFEKYGSRRGRLRVRENGTFKSASGATADLMTQNGISVNPQPTKIVKEGDKTTEPNKSQYIRDWTFSPEILAEAKELRLAVRERRASFLSSSGSTQHRRNLLKTQNGKRLRVYCIDDKPSKFLDDAFSVEKLGNDSIVRFGAHITDVDQVVKYGSPIDDIARDRGQSLYLPLKPLHMLPASVMDAASFNTTLPAEAITVMIDFDVKRKIVYNWEVFPSLVPPVIRVNYDQFDRVIEQGTKAAQIDAEDLENLTTLANIAPMLAKILDHRNNRRRQRTQPGDSDSGLETRGVASVRLVKKSNRTSAGGTMKVAQVTDFRETGAHGVVGDLLTSVGALIRQFANENRAYLPEPRGASSYAARCGTAPLRRYADLAVQRQIKCVLFGRQPAGRRRMDELRVWLARRHSAGERTLAERRRSALFDSLSDHCAQQCMMSGSAHAVIRGQVRHLAVTKKGVLKVNVMLDGTGLSTFATVSEDLRAQMEALSQPAALEGSPQDEQGSSTGVQPAASDVILKRARCVMGPRTKVQVQITEVNTVTQQITASIISVVSDPS